MRGGFDVRSSADFLNNTAHNTSRKVNDSIEGLNQQFN